MYEPAIHGPLRVTAGWDPAMSAQGHMAWTSLALGFPERAAREAEAGVWRARDVQHVHTLVYALCFSVVVHHWRGDAARFRDALDEMRGLALEYQLVHFSTMAGFFEGQWQAEHGHLREGVEQMREALACYEALGARTSHARFVTAFGQALGRAGRADEGLRLVDGELATLGLSRLYEAELLRARGELLAMRGAAGDRAAAEGAFVHATRVARAQSAKGFELRALLGLHRLHGGPRHGDKVSQLESVLQAFTEGFDTEDLLAARALLAA